MRQSNKAINGQASVEVAIFGSIFLLVLGTLVSYGLSMSNQQDADMYAFRQAQVTAVDTRAKYFNDQTTYMVTADRRFPNPQDRYGTGQRAPISGSASVSWTNKQDLAPADPHNGNMNPRIFMEFVRYLTSATSGPPQKESVVYGPDHSTTTAVYYTTTKDPQGIWKMKDTKNKDPNLRHKWIPASDLHVGDKVDIGDENCNSDGMPCDVIRKEETIVDCQDDNHNGACDGDRGQGRFVFRDDQDGAIDMTITDADINHPDLSHRSRRQGLTSDYTSDTISSGTHLEVNQNNGNPTSSTHINVDDTVHRTIVRNGGYPDIVVDSGYKRDEDKNF